MQTRSDRSRFSDVLLAHAIRLVEAQGPLEDSEAMSQAFRRQTHPEARLFERARLLAQRIRLDEELSRWREMALLVWCVLAVLVFLMAYGIAAALLGGGRSINAVLAFFAVLGMHAFTLLLWLAGLAFSLLAGSDAGSRISLGRLFLRLVAWMPIDRGPHSLPLARAATELLRRSRLAPWVFGLISHSIWAASFLLVLAALWFGFSFREYRLTWETTILHADFFIRFVQWTGWLPGLFGFPLPDTSSLLKPDAAGSDHRAWALWLMGCTFVYGLLVRAVLAGLCWLKWRRGKNAVALDTSDPYFRKLLARFEQMEISDIVDREQHPGTSGMVAGLQKDRAAFSMPALVGFELPDEYSWPPEGMSESLSLNERIAGSSQERRYLLDRLAQLQPNRLLLACSLTSSPDRGTERFLREAAAYAGKCGILLLTHLPDVPQAYLERWQSWLTDTGMSEIQAFNDIARAKEWLETQHE